MAKSLLTRAVLLKVLSMAKPKVRFVISDEPSEITLTEVFAGACGTATLGAQGIHLWVPGDKGKIPYEKEIIFDFRNRPLTDKTEGVFADGMRGHFMTARVALLSQHKPSRIEKILEVFDYVLVPDASIKNTPADFRKRILSYEK